MPASNKVMSLGAALVLVAGQTACDNGRPDIPEESSDRILVFEHRIPAFGGELVGSNQGEFGGELAFRSHAGVITPLVEKNVVGLHAMSFGYIAITGLAHMQTNEGEVLSVSQKGTGRLSVDRIAVLPSAPMESRQRSDSIEMRLFSGKFDEEGKPMHTCWVLQADKQVRQARCPLDWREPKDWEPLSLSQPFVAENPTL